MSTPSSTKPSVESVLGKLREVLTTLSLTDTSAALETELESRLVDPTAAVLGQLASRVDKILGPPSAVSCTPTIQQPTASFDAEPSVSTTIPFSEMLLPDTWYLPAGSTGRNTDFTGQDSIALFEWLRMSDSNGVMLRKQRGRGTPQSEAVFHEPPVMSEDQANTLAMVQLPVLYNPFMNGLEDERELQLTPGSMIAGRCALRVRSGLN